MSKRKPRLLVTVEPEVDALLQDLYQLTGKPKATYVAELVKEALPALYELRDALSNVEDKKALLGHLMTMARMANVSNLQVNNEMMDLVGQIDWVEDSKDD